MEFSGFSACFSVQPFFFSWKKSGGQIRLPWLGVAGTRMGTKYLIFIASSVFFCV